MLVDTVKNRWGGETGTLISSFDYTNDAAGRRVGRDDDGLAFNTTVAIPNTFGYDLKSQVTGATMNNSDYSYIYDQIGNRTSGSDPAGGTIYTANAVNQYGKLEAEDPSNPGQVDTSVTAREPEFDADGNMTLNDGQDDDWTYVWDGENRLVEATSPGWKLNFIYDHQGRRVQKHVYSWNPSDPAPALLSQIFVYIYDGWNLITELEVNSSFTIQNSSFFLWGKDLSGSLQGAGGVGGLLMVEKDGQFYYSTFDANGNVSEYVKKGTQSTFVADDIVAHYEYDPFGNRTDGFTDSVDFAHRFSTKYLDTETALYYYGYRYYSSELGRWLNRDPLEEEGGENLVGFIDNDAENLHDVLGRDFIALAARPVSGLLLDPDGIGLGFINHLSLEYWQSRCWVGVGNELNRVTLAQVAANQNAPMLTMNDGVELLADARWAIWQRYSRRHHKTGRRTRHWRIRNTSISVIREHSDGTRFAAFFEPRRNNNHQVRQMWSRILNNARNYRWAEHNFPGSHFVTVHGHEKKAGLAKIFLLTSFHVRNKNDPGTQYRPRGN